MALDFRKILGTPTDQVEKPKPVPVGTYAAIISSFEIIEKMGKNDNPCVRVNFTSLQAEGDVDQDEIELAGGAQAIARRKMNTLFWLTEDALWRLKEFLEETVGLDTAGRPFDVLLPEMVNVPVRLEISHRVTDRNEVAADVKTVLRAE